MVTLASSTHGEWVLKDYILPEDAWNDLPSEKKQVMVEYAQYCGLKAIVVGK